jgi:hypothetical protein
VTFALDSDAEQEEDDYHDEKEKKASTKRSKGDNKKQEEKKEDDGNAVPQLEGRASHRQRQDWTVCRRRRSIWHYGYEHDLDEWKMKRDMALWQFNSSNTDSVFYRATACHSRDNAACADDNCAGSKLTRPPPRISGQGAVRDLFARKQERLQRRKEKNERRHVPEGLVPAPKPWQLAFKERCKSNPGYIGIEQYSLLDSTGTSVSPDSRDLHPWETRDVRQYFLHERSISLSRNWFGKYKGSAVVSYCGFIVIYSLVSY